MLFSIVIPTFNRAKIAAATVRSVLLQSYPAFEVIVVDDGSTDDTEDEMQRLNDTRIRYFYKENQERSIARNYGADRAAGDYLIFLDSDDRLQPSHLAQLNDFLLARGRVPFLVSAYNIVGRNGEVHGTFNRTGIFDKKRLVFGNPLCCSPVTIKTDVFRKFRFNTEPKLVIFEDWELWLRIISEHELHCVPGPSVIITNHEERSVVTTAPVNLAEKVEFLATHAVRNIPLLHASKRNRALFISGLYSYAALHIAMHKGYGQLAVRFLLRSVTASPAIMLKKRFLAILKHILLP